MMATAVRTCFRGAFLFAVALALTPSSQPAVAEEIRSAEDHLLTGFPLVGAHARVECQSCHSRGVFAGLPTRCTFCHLQGGPVAATVKSTNHIPTTMECDVCHSDQSFHIGHFDHVWVTAPCVTCHNNATSRGKTQTHIPSSNTCDNCHTTRSWRGARFDHGGVTSPCATCHNGTTVTGKPANHIPTSSPCDACHNTNAWRSSSLRGETGETKKTGKTGKPTVAEGRE